MRRFEGYHSQDKLPIKRGDAVTIVKGTTIVYRGKTIKAGRTYRVKVDHVLPGTHSRTITNPSVRWAGRSGYWCEADINQIPEAQK